MISRRVFKVACWTLAVVFGMVVFVSVAAAEISEKQIVLKVGGSQLVAPDEYWPELNGAHFKRISAINPAIIDVQVISPKLFYVFGKKLGSTSLILWEKDKDEPEIVDVIVFLDVTGLKQKIYELYPPPSQNIQVYASETGVVLSGTVTGPEIVEQVIRLTQTFLPILAEDAGSQSGTGRSGSGITNLLKVQGGQQVMLEVKFAEVNRNTSKDWQAGIGLGKLGNDFNGAISSGGKVTSDLEGIFGGVVPGGSTGLVDGTMEGLVTGDLGSVLLNMAGATTNVFINVDNLTASLEFLESEGLGRILAEPRLVTQSGQQASFLAGGEFPVPMAGDDNEIDIVFKEFGVALRFTPVVLSDGTISLHVAPSVSEIASTTTIPSGISGTYFNIPNLSTRKLDTTVQLKDGQTFAIAGLLKDSLREEAQKIPGLGDLPVLGTLFRSTAYLQEKTDLLVAVTPHLVKPVEDGSIRFPGESIKLPNGYEFYLEGRFEGGRESEQSEPIMSLHSMFLRADVEDKKGGLEGSFGYEPVQ